MRVVAQFPELDAAVQVPGPPSISSAPAAAVALSSAAPSLAALSSATPQKEVSSAGMSQELPSFHDWSQNTASPSSKSDATSAAAAASAALSDAGKHPQNAQSRLQHRSLKPDLAVGNSVLIAAGLAQPASASAQLSARQQNETKLFDQQSSFSDDFADQQDKGLQSGSSAPDMTDAGKAADVTISERGRPQIYSCHAFW